MKILGAEKAREQAVAIYEYEFEGLLAALRRDLHAEVLACDRAGCQVDERNMHCTQARMAVRLLELFNPKQVTEESSATPEVVQAIRETTEELCRMRHRAGSI